MVAKTLNHIPNVVTACPPDLRIFRGGRAGLSARIRLSAGMCPPRCITMISIIIIQMDGNNIVTLPICGTSPYDVLQGCHMG